MIAILGNGVRTQILHYLAQRPMTVTELADLADLHYSSIHRHLPVLEREGLVSADQPPDKRRGAYVKVHWSTNLERVAELAAQWAQYARSQKN